MDFEEYFIKAKELNPYLSREQALKQFEKINPYLIV